MWLPGEGPAFKWISDVVEPGLLALMQAIVTKPNTTLILLFKEKMEGSTTMTEIPSAPA